MTALTSRWPSILPLAAVALAVLLYAGACPADHDPERPATTQYVYFALPGTTERITRFEPDSENFSLDVVYNDDTSLETPASTLRIEVRWARGALSFVGASNIDTTASLLNPLAGHFVPRGETVTDGSPLFQDLDDQDANTDTLVFPIWVSLLGAIFGGTSPTPLPIRLFTAEFARPAATTSIAITSHEMDFNVGHFEGTPVTIIVKPK